MCEPLADGRRPSPADVSPLQEGKEARARLRCRPAGLQDPEPEERPISIAYGLHLVPRYGDVRGNGCSAPPAAPFDLPRPLAGENASAAYGPITCCTWTVVDSLGGQIPSVHIRGGILLHRSSPIKKRVDFLSAGSRLDNTPDLRDTEAASLIVLCPGGVFRVEDHVLSGL